MALACGGGEHTPAPTSPPPSDTTVVTIPTAGTVRVTLHTVGSGAITTAMHIGIGALSIDVTSSDSVGTVAIAPGTYDVVAPRGNNLHCVILSATPQVTVASAALTDAVVSVECHSQFAYMWSTLAFVDTLGRQVALTDGSKQTWTGRTSPGNSVLLVAQSDAAQVAWSTFTAGQTSLQPLGVPPTANLRQLSLSPDGAFIAAVRPRGPDGIGRISIFNRDGSGERIFAPNGDSSNELPTWSPDGTRLAFLTIASGRQTLSSARVDGSDLRFVTDLGARYVDALAWSPDGTMFAIQALNLQTSKVNVGVVPASGGAVRPLWNGPWAWAPKWSPDSRQLIFTTAAGPTALDGYGIAIVNADGTSPRSLAETPGYEAREPDWSPDGRLIIFERHQMAEYHTYYSHIAVIRPDGTGLRELGLPQVGSSPVWLPGVKIR